MFVFLAIPLFLLWYKHHEYNKIVQNKEYVLTKKGKILTISSENEFLPTSKFEIIYDDDKTVQIKLDEHLYSIDKIIEKIDEQ